MKGSAHARGLGVHHRRVRLVVLERDGWRCQYPVGDGQVCGEYADTAGHHVTARVDGGLSTVANLRAECRRHNFSDGGRIGARKRAERRTPSFFRDGPCP